MVAEFITENVGLPQEIWQKNTDMVYLYECTVTFRNNRSEHAEKILKIIRPRLKMSGAFEELKSIVQNLVKRSEAENKPDTDLFIAQAIEIVANDYWLIDEMIKEGAPSEAISAIKSNIVEDAIDVGRRLLRNARRKIQAIFLPKAPLDESLIHPLGDFLTNDQRLSGQLKLPTDVKRVHLIINAGRSTRVRTTIPKGIIYLEGRPLIQYTIDAGRKAGCDATVVVLGFKKEVNAKFLRNDIPIIIQPSVEGTAHAVMQAFSVLRNFEGTLLVSFSDMPFIQSETLQALLNKHETYNPVMSILTTSQENRPEFGRLIRDKEGNIERIAQVRVESTESDLVDAGFYCFQSPQFWKHMAQIENRNNRYEYLLTDIVSKLYVDKMSVLAHETQDKIETIGINRPNELIKALEIGCFTIRKKYSHTKLSDLYNNLPKHFLNEILDFYKKFYFIEKPESFGLQDPNKNKILNKNFILKVQEKLENQIGALFYLQED